MWIETFDGTLLNLADVRRVILRGKEEKWSVVAEMPSSPNNSGGLPSRGASSDTLIIAEFGNKADGAKLMTRISDGMGVNLIRIGEKPVWEFG